MTSSQGPAERGTDESAVRWQPDKFLDRYEVATIGLRPDPDRQDPITATLVRRPAGDHHAENGAVLYVHGFTDYFFHEPLADHFADLGYAFYAIDLRKCGRSLEPQHTPHYATDLRVYDEELGAALDIIIDDLGPQTPVIISAHSTGGLITALWLDRLRRDDPDRHRRVVGLLLNSPWLDLQGEALLRTFPVTLLIAAVAAARPMTVIPQELSAAYGESIHESANGEWSYDLDKKPLGGFPVTFGFLNAVRTAQRHLHHGIDVGVPSLVLRSDKTHFSRHYSAAADAADAVLDVAQIARWSGCLGNRVTTVPIGDARHDVFLSVPHAREQAYREVDAWLSSVLGVSVPDTPDRDTPSADRPSADVPSTERP
ncbi:alpha/beta hydrolase [Gordonia sp. DT30]|uniref:alpha/beta hydrolase n=1 Tax=unclassified Gordonia (in: high G+C Gram-positive bacteria) TaxID=2657482 RepID=UPI003CF74944